MLLQAGSTLDSSRIRFTELVHTMTDDNSWDEDVPYDEVEVDDDESVNFAVRLVNVSRTYTIGNREVSALKSVNMEIRPGEFVAVSGPSGSGKTTLLNVIGAIDYVTSGSIFVMDVTIGDYDEAFRATFRLANTGFIFQNYNLVSTLTALENVMFPMQLTDQPIKELEQDAIALLKLVKLEERADHLPWQLSAGEQQRVAVARALANDPPIILADEPTANLDSVSAEMVRELLRKAHGEGKAIIAMTHDEKIVKTKGAKRFRMDDGVLKQDV
ncbi:MAG: ABC transporter ATP-binding protein [Candidatus Thorarchaeota archaeon]|nr:ABC transporter ATP-binding protein [Candidatus Thorarchaeota archaeon]